jgi:subtilisin family serine protease
VVDAKIDQSWPFIGSTTFKIGVIDIGFAPHEDLHMTLGLPIPVPIHDHGNHTAGILCAQHNGIGIKGAVPNCTAVTTSGSFVIDRVDPIERVNTRFHALLMDTAASITQFILRNNAVKEINVSMGYNWMPRLNINPEEPRHAAHRDQVREDGVVFLCVLAVAIWQDVAIISAAGNDSDNTPSPVHAKWASPFNWAAFAMKEVDGWSNGIVVEAHDKEGRRALLSNSGGHISAAGVKIFSTLASNRSAYGPLDGTSAAAPHVAGGLAIIRKLRPGLSMQEALSCLLSSPNHTDSGAPRLDLLHAITVQCPSARASRLE